MEKVELTRPDRRPTLRISGPQTSSLRPVRKKMIEGLAFSNTKGS